MDVDLFHWTCKQSISNENVSPMNLAQSSTSADAEKSSRGVTAHFDAPTPFSSRNGRLKRGFRISSSKRSSWMLRAAHRMIHLLTFQTLMNIALLVGLSLPDCWVDLIFRNLWSSRIANMCWIRFLPLHLWYSS